MNYPGLIFLSQQHWSVPRHATLWQKMLVTLPVTFPLTVLTIKGEYSGSLEADMSENTQVVQVWSEKSFLSVVQNLFGCNQFFLKQDHKLRLVTLRATFPLTVLTTSEVYSGSLEADMSENHPSCSSVKWQVLPLFCLRVFWMQSTGHSHVQVASIHGEGLFETQASTVEHSWITLAHDSYPCSISLSRDIWHRRRRYL